MRYVRNGWCGKCGVYLITCKVNGKRYVGSSVNLASRINQHFGATCLRRYADINPFYADIRQFGRDAFIVEVLEFSTPDKKLETERKWYHQLRPEYNLVEPDECPFKHQAVQQKSFDGCHTEQGRINRMKSHSSEEYREKLRATKRTKMKPCRAYAPDGTFYDFPSRMEAAKWIKPFSKSLPSVISHISGAINQNGCTYGYRWVVIDR